MNLSKVNFVNPITNKNQVGFGYALPNGLWRVKCTYGIFDTQRENLTIFYSIKKSTNF